MRPLIKYRGGKRREILEFERFLPGQFDRYIEPFLGGGAVFFHMEPERAVLNDINGRLMGFYQEVRDDYERLSRELAGLQLRYEEAQAAYKKEKERYPKARVENRNEALYYQLRDMYNGIAESPYLQGTLYYFINKTASRILDLSGRKLTNYLGNYEYYLEKKETLSTPLSPDEISLATPSVSDTKQNWKAQKEQLAAQRKKENELKKCEETIEQLEQRNAEIDLLMASPQICTDVAKLQSLNQEKEANDTSLSELYEKWELLSE